MNTVLVFGVLLIVAGIALAILAYALVLNRRGESAEGEEPAEPSAELAVPPPAPAYAPPSEPEPGLSSAPASGPEPSIAATPVQPIRTPAPAAPTAQPAAPPAPVAAPPQPAAEAAAPPPPRTIDVARLLRDEVTGGLMIGVGTRVYRTADELRDSVDWQRMQSAARDLQLWFTAQPRPKGGEERRSAEEASARAGSMLDQINAILERKLAQAPELPQGVRLAPSPEGGVRVLIGLQAYPLDQVPDAKINQLIRESVTEWENQG